jgi:hypothetical protein
MSPSGFGTFCSTGLSCSGVLKSTPRHITAPYTGSLVHDIISRRAVVCFPCRREQRCFLNALIKFKSHVNVNTAIYFVVGVGLAQHFEKAELQLMQEFSAFHETQKFETPHY